MEGVSLVAWELRTQRLAGELVGLPVGACAPSSAQLQTPLASSGRLQVDWGNAAPEIPQASRSSKSAGAVAASASRTAAKVGVVWGPIRPAAFAPWDVVVAAGCSCPLLHSACCHLRSFLPLHPQCYWSKIPCSPPALTCCRPPPCSAAAPSTDQGGPAAHLLPPCFLSAPNCSTCCHSSSCCCPFQIKEVLLPRMEQLGEDKVPLGEVVERVMPHLDRHISKARFITQRVALGQKCC